MLAMESVDESGVKRDSYFVTLAGIAQVEPALDQHAAARREISPHLLLAALLQRSKSPLCVSEYLRRNGCPSACRGNSEQHRLRNIFHEIGKQDAERRECARMPRYDHLL